MTNEPKYDEDVVNLGYLNRVIDNTEETINREYENVSRHYGSQPTPPYYKGDTWVDGNIVYTCINTRKIGTYQNSDWTTESGATELATKKNQVFLRQPSNYNAGDMWILQTDTDHRNGKRGEILIATVGRTEYDEGDWVNMLAYGTQVSINEIASNLNSAIDRIGVTEEAIADGIIITFYQNTIPEGKHIGDLWYVTDTLEDYIKGKIYRYNGSEWQLLNDPDIEKAFNEANEARIIADGKIQSFYSAEEPTKDMGIGDLWIDTDDNNKLYRYNGTNWIPVYDTRVDEVVGKIEDIEIEQEQTAEELIEVNKSLTIIRSAAEAAQTGAAQAQKSADEANSKVAEALEETSQIRTEVAEAKEDIGNVRTEVSGQIETLSNTMEADYSKKTDLASTESTLRTEISQSATQIQTTVEQTYAKKTDLTEVESSLQTQITQNSEEIKSTASSVTRIDADVSTAKQDIVTAQTAADNAKSAAAEAEKNLNIAKENLSKLQTQANATDEQLSAAKQEIEAAEIAVGNAQKAAEAAQKKADDTYKELDALDKRVTNNETAISQKADSVTVTAIQTKLDNLEEVAATKSELKVATDGITTKVGSVEKNLKDNYSTTAQMNTAINQKADSITSTVSQTYITKTESATNISNAKTEVINGMHIGARNLELQTETWGKWNNTTGIEIEEDVSKISTEIFPWYGPIDVEINQEYIISVDVKSDIAHAAINGIILLDYFDENNVSQQYEWLTGAYTTEWIRKDWKFTVPNNTNIKRLAIGFRNSAKQVIYFKKLKVEKGNKATDWSPAPEDILEDTLSSSKSAILGLEDEIDKTKKDLTIELSQKIIDEIENYNKETVQTQFTQVSDGFSMTFEKLIAPYKESIDGNTDYTSIASKYIKFINGKILLGEEGNKLQLQLENEKISFLQDGTEVAYMSNNKLYITRAEILDSLQLGNFSFIPRSNGNLSFKKVGGN